MSASQLSRIARSLYRKGSWSQRSLQRWRPWICPFEQLLALIPPHASVLDVGCGGGLFLFLTASLNSTATGVGIDLSPSSIAFAQRNVSVNPGLQPRLQFQVLDATGRWPVSRFDVVSLVDVLHHVPPERQIEVLQEALAHLNPGGLLLYKDMCDSPWWLATANRVHDLLLAQQWIHYLPIEAVEQWAVSNSLTLVQKVDTRRYWYGHELRAYRRRLPLPG